MKKDGERRRKEERAKKKKERSKGRERVKKGGARKREKSKPTGVRVCAHMWEESQRERGTGRQADRQGQGQRKRYLFHFGI